MAPPKVDVSQAVGYRFKDLPVSWNRRDLLLYAAGLNLEDNCFAYENDKSFAAFPTYPLVLPLKGASFDITDYAAGANLDEVPGLPKIDLRRLVHGEQYFERLAPLPLEGNFTLTKELSGLWDTGKGMIMDMTNTLQDANGKPLAKMIASAFIIGAGGWGGSKKPLLKNVVPTPKRDPDFVVETKTSSHQALIYRLSGDYNPLHVDAQIGKTLGMQGVILHGLCTYGISVAAILKKYANNDPNLFKSIYGRFASPVYLGETLQTVMWKAGESSDGLRVIAFITKVKERNAMVIGNGTVELFAASPKL